MLQSGTLAHRIDENTIRINVKPKSEKSIPAGIHLMLEGDTNYFHFVTEILPRLELANSLNEYTDLPLLITGGLHENLLTALATVNNAERAVIELDPDVPYHVEHLVYPSDTASILNIYGRRATREEGTISIDWLRRVRAAVIAKSKPRKPCVGIVDYMFAAEKNTCPVERSGDRGNARRRDSR